MKATAPGSRRSLVAKGNTGLRPVIQRRMASPEGVMLLLVAATLFGFLFRGAFDIPALRSWSTVFVATFVQALPFLGLGVAISAIIATFVSTDALQRMIPSRPSLAIPAAGLAGMALPGCECGAVPIAGRVISGGVRPAVGLTFLLAAPAVNPVVLVSTAVAFPGQPEIVLARYVASMLTAVVLGWIWIKGGREDLLRLPPGQRAVADRRWVTARNVMVHDFTHAGGFLVAGAMVAAGFKVLVPQQVVEAVTGNWLLAVLFMAALAVLLSLCSEADAFVASALPGFSDTSKLVFMVVGPAVDVKLFAMQVGVFGRRFAMRFAPTTLGVAILASLLVGWVLL
jgi:uncharacterized protein